MRKFLAIVSTYVVVASFVFAYHYENFKEGRTPKDDPIGLAAFGAGVFWPIYLTASAALHVVREAKKPSSICLLPNVSSNSIIPPIMCCGTNAGCIPCK